VPPLTGASSIATPFCASCSEKRRAASGSIVLMHSTISPCFAAWVMPLAPRITASAWAVVSTMQIVRWHLAATASGEVSTVAPAATSGSSRAELISCTTSSNPAFTRLSAIGPPILPSPTNPTLPAIAFLPNDGDDRSTGC
jgi:hypothetical protein